ncbi:MAG: dTDP-glucose 4,6-dehydratase [Candidatus Binatia bacterium]
MRTILVTGGCGFIGSNFVRLIVAETDCKVVNLDKLTYAGNLANLADIDPTRMRFVGGDICDRELVEAVFRDERPWAVVNFAAESHVDRSILDSAPFLRTNTDGVRVLLDAARHFRIDRFLQISTDETYGDKEGQATSNETSSLNPSSPYAASKAAADLLCFSYRRTYELPVVITRSSNNYGPFQFPEKLIPLLIRNALKGMELPVYGDGGQIRDWLHVEDNCRAILAVLERGHVGAIYNIGTGEERTNLMVVDALCAAIADQTGISLNALKKLVCSVTDRPGHDRRYAIDTSRVQRETGWHSQTAFDEGLRKTVRWYLDHQNWIASVTSGEYRNYYDSVYKRFWERST